MSSSREQLWARLVEAGLVQGAPPPADKAHVPWFVKALLAMSGWIAGSFLIGFLAVGLDLFDKSDAFPVILGGALMAGAYLILRESQNEFLENFGLAVSLAGQMFFLDGMREATGYDDTLLWLMAAVLQVALVVVMPSFLHRVFSAFFAPLAFAGTFFEIDIPYLPTGLILFAAVWVWRNEHRFLQHLDLARATGYGLVLAVIAIQWVTLLAVPDSDWAEPWMGEVIAGVALLYLVWDLLERYRVPTSSRVAKAVLVGTLVICAASLEVPGVCAGVAILLLGFAERIRLLLGLGVIALLIFVSSYYYSLETTLLVKAQTLLVIGLVLLTLRWLMSRLLTEASDA